MLRLHISFHPRRLVAGNNVMWMERAHENHTSQVSMACVTPIVVVRRQLCATMPRIYHQPESLGELYSTSLWFFLCVHFEFSANASNECVGESALGAKDQVVTVCDDDSGSFVICVRCFVASGSKTKKKYAATSTMGITDHIRRLTQNRKTHGNSIRICVVANSTTTTVWHILPIRCSMH